MGARKSNEKSKGRFIGIPYHVAKSEYFGNLNFRETKLIMDLLIQYNGYNNGSMSPCFALMNKRGWNSSSTLHRAFNGLKEKGFLIVTRQGVKKKGFATLVAITWLGIDEPQNDQIVYDTGIKVSHKPLAYWCKSIPKAV